MSELAVAVFAADTDAHLLDAPRTARFASFCRRFDEPAYLRTLAAAGLRWIARDHPAFPSRLRAIHDPPPGLFVRGNASSICSIARRSRSSAPAPARPTGPRSQRR